MKENKIVVGQEGGDLEKDLVGRYDPGSGFALVWRGFTYSDGQNCLHIDAMRTYEHLGEQNMDNFGIGK